MSRFESLRTDMQCEEEQNRYFKHNNVKLKNMNKFVTTQHACSEIEPGHSKSYTSQNIFSGNANTEGNNCNNNSNHDKHEISKGHKRVFGEKTGTKKLNNEAKVTFQEDNNVEAQNLHELRRERMCTDKTTYCRPVVNLYNQQYLYKTIEKNARLQSLVKDLIIARRREKEIENWNNYINQLKKKHGDGINRRRTSSLHYIPKETVTRSTNDDYYKTKFASNQYNLCHNLHQDFYDTHNMRHNMYSRTPNDYENPSEKGDSYHPFKTNLYCYPTSSQGRLQVLERERQNQLLLNRRYNKSLSLYRTVNEEVRPNKDLSNMGNRKSIKINQKHFFQTKDGLILYDRATNTIKENASTQTEFQVFPSSNDLIMKMVEHNSHSISKNTGTNEPNNVKTVQENIQSSDSSLKKNSLANIEEKLDSLINSINSFMSEIKTKKYTRHSKCLDRLTKLEKQNVYFTKSDSYTRSLSTAEKVVCGLVDNSSNSTANSSDINKINIIDNNLSKINDIILKAMDKNTLVALKDSCVGETCQACAVQISVCIPTKEISTEVTRSLSKAEYSLGDKNVQISVRCPMKEISTEVTRSLSKAEYSSGDTDVQISVCIPTKEISTEVTSSLSKAEYSSECKSVQIEQIKPLTSDERRIAMAVNTEPVSLLTLLRVSTEETMRRLLSYVPNIDYYYYLTRLQGPQIVESQFICNICGASFVKPSQLTDHIQKHELGKTRDCCVCRHVLDMPRRRPGLFKCPYCGQQFTRAYCCELHQQSCARRLGIPHDIASSLMLLK